MIAKKQARESDTVSSLELLSLNEYGDCTSDEYQSKMAEPPQTSTGDVLGQAVAAAELQNEASAALSEAADALAEEEEVRF